MVRSATTSGGAWARASLLTLAMLASCLEYSPHALPTDPSERDLNVKAIARLRAQPQADPAAPLRFAIIGDVHHSYEELEDAVARLNAIEGIELAVQIGDFTHLGTLQEYRLAKERIDGLHAPYLVAIGNHDLLGNGGAIFDRMFGVRDATFVYRGVRFVLLDTNSREHGFGAGVPRLDWLAGELSRNDAAPESASPQRTIVFAHVPPSSADFHPDLGPSYLALLRDNGVIGAFYGHEHRFGGAVHDGLPYFIADALERRSLLVVTLRDGTVEVEQEPF